MYAKLENGRLIFPPSMLQNVPRTFPPEEPDGEPITGLYQIGYDPDNVPDYISVFLLSEGYLPVNEAPEPDYPEGYHGEYHWTEGDGEIQQVWEQVSDPDPMEREVDAGEALEIITGGLRE